MGFGATENTLQLSTDSSLDASRHEMQIRSTRPAHTEYMELCVVPPVEENAVFADHALFLRPYRHVAFSLVVIPSDTDEVDDWNEPVGEMPDRTGRVVSDATLNEIVVLDGLELPAPSMQRTYSV